MTATPTMPTGPTDVVLAARSAQLYYAYARAVDAGDLDALRAMVTEDVRITRGAHPTEQGVEAFLDVYRAHNAMQIPVCQHVVTNVQVERQGDDVVTHAYFRATMLEEAGTRVIFGFYDDVHREVDGKLRLAHKQITVQRVLELPASSDSFRHAGK